MTILESFIIHTIRQVQREKLLTNREPSYCLIVADELFKRTLRNHQITISPGEFDEAIRSLALSGEIKVGPTINDTYVELRTREIESSL